MRADIAASFQNVAVRHLAERTQRGLAWALEGDPGIRSLVLAGGVAANRHVRSALTAVAEGAGVQLVCPRPSLCTDNGVMIAWAAIERCASVLPVCWDQERDNGLYDLIKKGVADCMM